MTLRNGARWPLVVLACCATPTLAPAAQAQSSQPATRSDGEPFGTITVTARKRDEAAQKVPIAIDVYDQRSIDRLDIRTVEDLRYSSPSVYIAPSTFRQDTLNVTIRGQQNFQSTGLQFDTSTAVYVDGVYLARPVGLLGTLFDVDRVQVLKGPQGTLVGRNSTGGAILYETRQPTADLNGYARLTLGDYGRRDIQIALNVPLTSTLFVRAAFAVARQRGYIENFYVDPATGDPNRTPGLGYRRVAGQVSLKWQPTDDLSVLLRGKISDEDYTGVTYHSLDYFVGTAAAPGGRPSICNIPGTCTGFTDLLGHVITPYLANFATGSAISTLPGSYNALLNSVARSQQRSFWSTEQAISNGNTGHYETYSLVADKRIGGVDVKISAAHRGWHTDGSATSRGLPYATNIFTYRTPHYRSRQAELTLNGTALGERVAYTGGLFHFGETSPTDGDAFALFLPNAMTPAAVTGRQISFQDAGGNGGRNRSYAAYAQATATVLPGTRLTAGVRYTIDKRRALLTTRTTRFPATPATTAAIRNAVFDPGNYTLLGTTYTGVSRNCTLTDAGGVPLPLALCRSEIRRTFRQPTWTVAVDHDLFEGTLVYATARSGYRSGAINSGAINPLVTVAKPERVYDVEVGVKSDWSLGRVPLRTNLALYRSDYRNIQIQTTLPNVSVATAPGGVCTQGLFNAGQCLGTTNDNVTLNARRARIVGAEGSINLHPVPRLSLEGQGSFLHARYIDYSFDPPPGYLLPTGQVNLSGTPFPLPKWQLNGTATYRLPVRALTTIVPDGIEVSYHVYYQSRFLADLRTYDPSQRTSGYAFSDLRIGASNIAGSRIDLSVAARNLFNKAACVPEPQGVLNSAPNATFGVARTSGVLQCVPLPPRMVSGTIGFSF